MFHPPSAAYSLPRAAEGGKRGGENTVVMNIKDLRQARGLDQTELADRMGVKQSTVSEWEREVYLPKARDLPRLAQVLGCSIGALFADEEDADEAG